MDAGRIVLAGGSGFLGRTLGPWLAGRGHELVVLSRGAADLPWARVARWDGRSLGDWSAELEGARALVNLAGRSVDCRYTRRNRRAILDSRVLSTRVLGEAVARCARPPEAWIQSSTATIYEHTYCAPHGETGSIAPAREAKDAFSIEVARAWERELERAATPHTRKVVARTALVLGNEPGGVYPVLRRLVRAGLGGRMGHGRQYVSWIHADDYRRAVARWIDDRAAEGVYNLCAPEPLPNSETMAVLRRELGARFGLPAPRWVLEAGAILLRTETELVVKSRRVVPARLLAEGFRFEHERLADAVRALERVR